MKGLKEPILAQIRIFFALGNPIYDKKGLGSLSTDLYCELL
jgi:hypothetical protein